MLECPRLWRITIVSQHNEGICKWVNWAPIFLSAIVLALALLKIEILPSFLPSLHWDKILIKTKILSNKSIPFIFHQFKQRIPPKMLLLKKFLPKKNSSQKISPKKFSQKKSSQNISPKKSSKEILQKNPKNS